MLWLQLLQWQENNLTHSFFSLSLSVIFLCYDQLCESLEELDEPEAKASMIWIIGEYAERIENADELLDSFLDTFQEETSQVQLQLLTATVKLFLKSPDNSKEMMESVLAMATEESDNPDLRDRGFVYWRLLSTDPEAARQVVLAEKPIIDGDTFDIESSLLDELISNISTLASVYHKPPDAFAPRKKGIAGTNNSDDSDDSGDDSDEYEDSDDSDDSDDSGSDSDGSDQERSETKSSKKKKKKAAEATPAAPQSSMEDLLGLGGLDMGSGGNNGGSSATTSSSGGGGGLDDLFGTSSSSSSMSNASNATPIRPVVVPSSANAGYEMRGSFEKNSSNDTITLELDITNNETTSHPGQFQFQFQKNLFALAPSGGVQCGSIQPGATVHASLPVTIQKKQYQPQNKDPLLVAVAGKHSCCCCEGVGCRSCLVVDSFSRTHFLVFLCFCFLFCFWIFFFSHEPSTTKRIKCLVR